jgi:hypothetical protein
MIENLSTETLREIRNNIDKIIQEREKDWELDSGLTFEEKKAFCIEEWEANMEEFQKMLPGYIEQTRQLIKNADYSGTHANFIFDFEKWNRIIKKLHEFKEFCWFKVFL